MRALVADDHPLFLAGLVRELESNGVAVVATCGDGLAVIAAMGRADIDVFVLDVRMPQVGGIEVCSRIIEKNRDAIVIFLSTYDEPAVVEDAMAAGARGFFSKETNGAALVAAMNRLASSPTLVIAPHALTPRLTPRESQVLKALISGLGNSEVAEILEISVETVKDHVEAIFRKFEAAGRIDLLLRANALGYRLPPSRG